MGNDIIPMPNFLPVEVKGTQLEVAGFKTEKDIDNSRIVYSTIFEPLNMAVGATNALFEENNIGDINVADIYVGLYTEKDGYYLVSQLKNKPKMVKRLTNFIFKPIRKIYQRDFNNSDFLECRYEVLFFVDEMYYTIAFSNDELQSLKKFEKKMAGVTHILTAIDDKMHKNLIVTKLSEIKNLPAVTEFKTAGYNNYNNLQIFVTENNYFAYAEQDIVTVDDIILCKKSILQPRFVEYKTVLTDENIKALFRNTSVINEKALVSLLLIRLFEVLELAYKGQIEPFLVISMAFMTVFLKQIANDFEGTPIVALYGEAASGKSNLLRLVASIFGLDKSVLHGGMDTLVGVLQDLESYVNIPLLIDEVELQGENSLKQLVKSVYGQTGRKKFNNKNNINTTVFYNTNYKFLYDREYINRCLSLNFSQNNFDCHEAEKFNGFQSYLPFATKHIIENVPYSEIKATIRETENSTSLDKIEDNRIKRNLAIVITGLKTLINVINAPLKINIQDFEDRLHEYITKLSNIQDDDTNRFIAILKELLADNFGKLKHCEDYKILSDGLHIFTANKETTFFENQFKQVYQKHFRGSRPLSLKEYSKLLIKQGAQKKNEHYSQNIGTKYGLFLPFNRFEELRYLADRQETYINQAEQYLF